MTLSLLAPSTTCTSIDASVSDAWCASNCLHQPPNCPEALCVCEEDDDDDDLHVDDDSPRPPSNASHISGAWLYIADGFDGPLEDFVEYM